jgi:hypothetical protein
MFKYVKIYYDPTNQRAVKLFCSLDDRMSKNRLRAMVSPG